MTHERSGRASLISGVNKLLQFCIILTFTYVPPVNITIVIIFSFTVQFERKYEILYGERDRKRQKN